jgi:hypothetical protein
LSRYPEDEKKAILNVLVDGVRDCELLVGAAISSDVRRELTDGGPRQIVPSSSSARKTMIYSDSITQPFSKLD